MPTESEAWEALEAFEANPTAETWKAAQAAAHDMGVGFFASVRYMNWALHLKEPHLAAMRLLP